MSHFLSVIIPIISIILCIGIYIYSKFRHKWEITAEIAIIIAIVLAFGTLVQGLGSKLSSDRDYQEQREEYEELRFNQDNAYGKLLEIEAKIDSRLSYDDNLNDIDMSDEKPSDEITDWVVKNRNDVIYKDDIFFVDIYVRKSGEKEWQRAIEASVGDIIEFQMEYCNRGKEIAEDIMVRSDLPENMEYIEGSTVLYNANFQGGTNLRNNSITTSGINIGDYQGQSNAFVRFKTKIIDVSLAEGYNHLYTWATITQNGEALYYDASVFVKK